jgi:Flp pilus assembly protein TadG
MLKNWRGQTFIEFALIFLVLFSATVGVFALYKSVWKAKYNKAKISNNITYTSITGGYVK